eukprot:TRINITY_DN12057_c0_g1_i2.p3 TRINITY_DN12057_c0_g1~~TRINITY_DN12057_c0_g1_i2.p3  ORF type:complete len:196 (+),score=44.73 TRINITY_DN12057_c0_g1_i2:151-738(+)
MCIRDRYMGIMSEEELKKKQDFLRTEIIDQGYLAERFIDYMVYSDPNNEGELKNYDLSQLEILVNNFKMLQKQQENITYVPKKESPDSSKKNGENQDKPLPSEEEKIAESKDTKDYQAPQDHSFQSVSPSEIFPHKEEESRIVGTQKPNLPAKTLRSIIVDQRFFKPHWYSSQYDTYIIHTLDEDWVVERSFSFF